MCKEKFKSQSQGKQSQRRGQESPAEAGKNLSSFVSRGLVVREKKTISLVSVSKLPSPGGKFTEYHVHTSSPARFGTSLARTPSQAQGCKPGSTYPWLEGAPGLFAAAAAKSLQSCPTLCDPIDGVGCHFLLQCMKVKIENEVAQSCLTLHDPMDCSLPGSSVHGIFQARVLEWGAIAFSNHWATREGLCQCYIDLISTAL